MAEMHAVVDGKAEADRRGDRFGVSELPAEEGVGEPEHVAHDERDRQHRVKGKQQRAGHDDEHGIRRRDRDGEPGEQPGHHVPGRHRARERAELAETVHVERGRAQRRRREVGDERVDQPPHLVVVLEEEARTLEHRRLRHRREVREANPVERAVDEADVACRDVVARARRLLPLYERGVEVVVLGPVLERAVGAGGSRIEVAEEAAQRARDDERAKARRARDAARLARRLLDRIAQLE